MIGKLTRREQVLAFIDVLASVGATKFDVVTLSLDEGTIDGKKIGGKKVKYRSGLSTTVIRRDLLKIIKDADCRECSVIMSHPSGSEVKFIQCDDLDEQTMSRLLPVAFMGLRTSPSIKGFQIWIAMRSEEIGDYYRRLRDGVSSDSSASEATRVPGSRNFKTKHKKADGIYPFVKLIHLAEGKIASREELEATGLLIEAKRISATRPSKSNLKNDQKTGYTNQSQTFGRDFTDKEIKKYMREKAGPLWRKFPDYEKCRQSALPGKKKGGADRDTIDFPFALYSAKRGFLEDEIADQIMGRSEKYHEMLGERGRRYARLKAESAVDVARTHAVRAMLSLRTPRRLQDEPKESDHPILPPGSKTGLPGRSNKLGEVSSSPKSPPSAASSLKGSSSGGIFSIGGASKSEVLAFVSTREDAVAVHEAVGIPAVALGRAFPLDIRRRTASKKVYLATRSGDNELLRRLCGVLTLCSGVERIRWPQEKLDEQTLLDTLQNLFAPHRKARRSLPKHSRDD